MSREWWPKEFLVTFGALLWHDQHENPECLHQFVMQPYKGATKKQIRSSPRIKYLVHVAMNPALDHYSILLFCLDNCVISVYDGLRYNLEDWIEEAEMILRVFSLVSEVERGMNKWRGTIRAGGWKLVRHVGTVEQTDCNSCGPIACFVLMTLLSRGRVCDPPTDMIVLRNLVTSKFLELQKKFYHETYCERLGNWMTQHDMLMKPPVLSSSSPEMVTVDDDDD